MLRIESSQRLLRTLQGHMYVVNKKEGKKISQVLQDSLLMYVVASKKGNCVNSIYASWLWIGFRCFFSLFLNVSANSVTNIRKGRKSQPVKSGITLVETRAIT